MKQFFPIWLTVGFVGLTSSLAFCAMPEKEYRRALLMAERKSMKKEKAQNTSEALSATTLKVLFGRAYQVGDNWDVVSWIFRNPEIRKTNNPQDLKRKLGPGGIFHYEVTRVTTGTEAEVDFKVTQVSSVEFKTIDPRVSHFNLTLRTTPQNSFIQAHKRYSFLDSNIENNDQTSLELFPLDIPEIQNADQQLKASAPLLPQEIPGEIPGEIQDVAHRLGFQPALSDSTEFQQDDFFGRPVQIIWQQGNPWPTYLRTVNGITLLVHKVIRKGRS